MMFFKLYDELQHNKQHCYYIQGEKLSDHELNILYRLLRIKRRAATTPDLSLFDSKEVGFYMHYMSPWCCNVLSIFKKAGIVNVERIERTTLIHNSIFDKSRIDPVLHCIYKRPIICFKSSTVVQHSEEIAVKDIGEFSATHNLAFDEEDIL